VENDDGDRIRLTVPATPASARIARFAAAGLATRAGFTYREVEQFRLAVDEAAAILTGHRPTGPGAPLAERGRLVVAYLLAPDGLHVEMTLEDDAPGEADGADQRAAVPHLAALLLDASIDAWEVAPDGRRVVLHKRRPDDHGDDEDE